MAQNKLNIEITENSFKADIVSNEKNIFELICVIRNFVDKNITEKNKLYNSFTSSNYERPIIPKDSVNINYKSDYNDMVNYELNNCRLNSIEEVEEKELEQANVFACPHCKQWLSMLIQDNILLRDIDEKEPIIHLLMSTAPFKTNSEITQYNKEDLSKLVLSDNVKYEVNSEKSATCLNCGNVSTLNEWKNAYDSILDKHEIICPSCAVINERTDDEKIKCNNCNVEYII